VCSAVSRYTEHLAAIACDETNKLVVTAWFMKPRRDQPRSAVVRLLTTDNAPLRPRCATNPKVYRPLAAVIASLITRPSHAGRSKCCTPSVRLSFRLSVSCFDLLIIGELWKLQIFGQDIRVTGRSNLRSKGQRSRSPGTKMYKSFYRITS